jgi:hypothetical protein
VKANLYLSMAAVCVALGGILTAQKPPDAPLPNPDKLIITANWRTRVESWDWFSTPGFQDNYTFGASVLRFGIGQKREDWDWQLELEAPILFNLPSHAVAPAPQGALGLGANYFQSNGTEAASVFPKTAFIRFKHYLGDNNSLKLGRFEFIDGAERKTSNATVNALKASRIAHRLIGNFSFAHVGRSFDGGEFDSTTKYGTFTLMGARATRGVFHVDGLGELDVDTAYAGFSRATKKDDSGEWRVFAMSYHDGRRTLKADNRTAPIRAADINNIRIGTFGGHVVQTFALGKDAKGKKGSDGTIDLLGWGAGQIGQWGDLNHTAWMLALEGGYQVPVKWRPWLRVGWSRASGDKNPNDKTHGTFFQMLPTPRIYARFPFYNQMNNDDAFGELILRPNKQFTIRSDLHSLRLAEATDLWYAGGGAFEKTSFGYAGRPSGGFTSLATVFDVSADWQINKNWIITTYIGDARGKSVIRAIYPNGANAAFAYTEVTFNY